ncbi:MAG: peptidase U32 family protein [Pseudomonadota bacterium]|jgi:collagenase-like PrtC family protease|nr:U32 family peptidase [Rubrivivax sp.]MCA3257514.1 U32 family peptidase [Rubrivivax sp.]MCZ8029890.1 U32 family peptidase [Rubrivivax sp.]
MPRRHLELLAPARDADIGIEAVNHGADAVYIGGPGFGARDKASNEVADIERLARHAHRYGARIFVTLNTILRDDELEPARRLAWQLHEAGADALIVQDMGLAMLDLPPIQLHASTQTDIRTPAKARFLQDTGFSQMVLARELDLRQIRAIAAEVQDAVLEFFVHGALCVAYSGQCFISHAHTGRSANRGSCSQECRLPYTVTDAQGRVIAHDKHVLSLKDNDQGANLEALVDVGIRSFKIEGRYKDVATVKNVTAHYRQLCDALLERRPELAAASSGRCRYTFQPDPGRAYHRGGTDYFVNGRRPPELGDIGAFDTPKHAGVPVGHVTRVGPDHFDVEAGDAATVLHNGDAFTWTDLQGALQGAPVNVAEPLPRSGGRLWRLYPNAPVATLKGLRKGAEVSRNRDMAWERLLDRKSAERLIGVALTLSQTADGVALDLLDDDGHHARVTAAHAGEPARDAARADAAAREHLARLGGTLFEAHTVQLAWREPAQPPFVPPSLLNALRRDGVAALEAARAAAFERLPRAAPVEPPVPYPEDTLTYLANVYNGQAAAFYARHGVKVVGAAYESHEELGEVSLMITRHCVRWSLSLCPKQAKGVTGVQGTVKAEPLTLEHNGDRLTLRFDCKPCEMHVVGRMRRNVLQDAKAQPLTFYRTRPAPVRAT